MASPLPTKEGFAPFIAPGANKPCQTWNLLIGSLLGPQIPLVALHGGPGACHEYLLPLQDVCTAHGTPLILYDQLGNGKSTRLREKAGDETFWTEALFCAELDNLLDHLGLHAPASVELLAKGSDTLRKGLPEEVQEVLNRCEAAGDFETEEYEAACMVYYKKHLCRMEPWPEELNASMGHLKEDPTVYHTMYGPSELIATGNLKHWSAVEQLHKIKASTLLINARYDEVVDIAMQPFFDRIAKVKWITLENSSHVGQFEERERYMEILGQFVNGAI